MKDDRRAERPYENEPYTEATLGTIDPSGYTAGDVAFDPTKYGYGPNEGGAPRGGSVGGVAGACSTTEGLGMASLDGLYCGPQHANKPAPIEYQADPQAVGPIDSESGVGGDGSTGVAAEHALSRLHRFITGGIADDYVGDGRSEYD